MGSQQRFNSFIIWTLMMSPILDLNKHF